MVKYQHVLLTCMLTLHVILGVHSAAKVDPSECRKLMDLYIVIDGSDSISEPDFGLLKQTIEDFLPSLDYGPTKARLGMLVYSTTVPKNTLHTFSYDINHLRSAARGLMQPRDGTNTNLGIAHMREFFLRDGRPGVPWVCVVITDGNSKKPDITAQEAAMAEKLGISMFAVGIGDHIEMPELIAIASTPNQAMKLHNFNELAGILSSMMTLICPCPIPMNLPLAQCNDGARAIGATRRYQCLKGYKQIGNPQIQCQSDFTWTPLDPGFQCLPCGDTPIIDNGDCGGGKFTLGSRRRFKCHPGYLAVGNPEILCLDDATWSPPDFRCIPCGDTPLIDHGFCGGGDYTLGSKRNFQCNPGYLAVGNPLITCQPDASWSMPDFRCIPCGDTPIIDNGLCGGGDYTLGAKRRFNCSPGYLAVGNPEIMCLPDATWSMPDFRCIPCGETPLINNGYCGGGDYTLGARRSFQCSPGYLAVGNPDIMCLPDATWSMPDFKCIPCGDTPIIDNGFCGGGDYTLGAKRSFQCSPGYLAVGNPDIMCLPDAMWSMPDFKCIPCGDTPIIDNGFCGGGDYTLGAKRSFQCSPGYLAVGNPDIMCLPDAMWSMPDFRCIPCGDTPIIDNGFCGGGDYTLGAKRSFQCSPGYLAVGNPDIMCLPDAMWSMPDFKCIPCGDTPIIDNGFCGGGDYTLGAKRSFQCSPGYLAVGNPDIMCLPDAMWSMPDFRCIPCGDTPIIDNGFCGGGDYTLGSRRIFQCSPGYLAVGNPDIMCLPDATWSMPDFRCIPCGDTPIIDNGFCGGGDYTLGAKRSFQCSPGYLAVGNPDIMCLPDAMWSMPDFKCIPCGDTPIIDNGFCGGGDYTLGAKRSFQCSPGYLAVGNPDIMCLPDAMWSMPDFRCIPCGDTPIIDNGFCGGGDYTLGAKRSFQCSPGYLAVGNPNIMCLPDASWSMPDFRCIPCGDTPIIDNGFCGGGDYTLGAKRSFQCRPGYLAVGNPDIMCLPDASWSMPDFRCIPCGDTPIIDNGFCGGGDYTLGAKRSFQCSPGYLAVGNPAIMCLPDATWSMPDFRCIPCGDTPIIDNGFCGGGDYTLGSRRIFQCSPGYLAVGNPDIMCQPDASWSMPEFKCIPCGDTPIIDNGFCGGGDYTLGAKRSFQCSPGYLAVGNPDIMCQPDASWSMPEFKCIPCGDTPIIDNGFCGGGDYILGSQRNFQCNPGYLSVGNPLITCLPDASWSIPDYRCIPCGDTPIIDHGVCGGGDYTLGAKRSFQCSPGYLAVGNPDIMCLSDATWSMPDFKCIPCGDTPIIDNGFCGGGDYTLGAKRSFQCSPGYLAVGNPDIMCLPDAMWSMPDFRCIPCGETPIIDNGFCGGGDYTLGARRSFQCSPGYLAVGNPDIMCQPDATWSLHDFKCIPCGDTPLLTHASCGGGDYTLGAVRTYSCDQGYLGIGDPTISCLGNAQWSVPDFRCSPCGEPPVIPNGECGGGDFLIGSQRSFKCFDGFLPVGSPIIECLNDATWSKPSIVCEDCGAPPMVANAFTNLGPNMLGSTREYFCNTGYDMTGAGQITCLPNGQWQRPSFSCNLRTTTTTTTPAPKPSNPSVCDACRLLNGVGYNNHPFDCNQYIQCFIGTRGMEPVYRRCPFGQFWDQNVLTCRPSHLVQCAHDKCASGMVAGYKASDPNNCCSYWKCQGGRAYGECCGDGMSYNAQLGYCEHDETCDEDCPYDDDLPACDKRPDQDMTRYQQHIGNNYWVPMPCAPGTAFNPVDCTCSLVLMTIPGNPRPQVCKPEIYLPFTGTFNDRSGKNVYILPENVTVHNGAAFFNGRSRILINRFSNTEFHGNLVVKFRYKEVLEGPTAYALQALVTNGDCGSDPSIVIAKMPGYVLLGAKTSQSRSFALPTLDKEWKEVIYMHDEKRLEGRVCGASMSKWSYGPIQATHCAMQIGYGNGLESYLGFIDDLYVYQCRPREDLLNIAY